MFAATIIEGLSDSVWKNRLAGLFFFLV